VDTRGNLYIGDGNNNRVRKVTTDGVLRRMVNPPATPDRPRWILSVNCLGRELWSHMNTCLMCNSLYVRANGELPCWDDVGEEELIFRTLDVNRLQQGTERSIFYSPEIQHIRQSFLLGKTPYPDVCKRCAVLGHGSDHDGIRPTTMNLLHLEASYLCHLSCPQCIPASLRHSLKRPPYHLSVPMLEGLLRQLRKEGVARIKVVHFEGRGDPLMNRHMDDLIAVTKSLYPDAFMMATTHGSYAYKPWIVESGLNLLRVAIDGAFPENYERYRAGGNFLTVLKFLRDIRDEKQRLHRDLKVDWKYILFEWNDSDEEIAHAARLAKELDVRLVFILTHSPGRSKRFDSASALKRTLQQVAPDASIESTFPLKELHRRTDNTESAIPEQVTKLLSAAVDAIRRGDESFAVGAIAKAFEYDPGVKCPESLPDAKRFLELYVPTVSSHARFPSTLAELAVVAYELGEFSTWKGLLRRHLVLALKEDLRKGRPIRAAGRIMLWLRVAGSVRTRLRNFHQWVFPRSMNVNPVRRIEQTDKTAPTINLTGRKRNSIL
jgi:molybdenum cofactor biosynthesis enzyme MoaA